MQVSNELYAVTDDQKRALKDARDDGPVAMLNLLKFHERARYPDGRDAQLTGRQAYQRYLDVASKIVAEMGGRVIYEARISQLVVGRVDELWDEILLVEYPSRAALVAMNRRPEWKVAALHREAGLAGQLLIETRT